MTLFQVFEFAFVCCSVASVALLVWDHLITFGAEVSRIWSRKFSGATVLYALLRYGTLLEKVSIMFLASWYMTPRGCDIAVRFQIFPMILRSLAFGLFSSLRVYALQGNDWRLAVFIFLLCLPSIITPTYSYTHQWSTAVDRYGCQLTYLASQAAHDHMRIAGIVADILSETIVIIVTVRKTARLRNNLNLAGPAQRPGLGRLLFRDGTVYFFALLILSLADMLVLVFDHVPQPVVGYDYWVVPYYTPVFRTIIICRFLLMLRAIYYDEGNEVNPQLGSLHFASRVVGTLGTTVNPDFDDEDDDSSEVGSTGEQGEKITYSKDPFATGLLVAEGSSKASSSGRTGERESEEVEMSVYTQDRESPVV